MPQVLAVGSARATSADFTLDSEKMVFLKTTGGGVLPAGCRVALSAKAADGSYTQVDNFTDARSAGTVPAGTYQVTRTHGTCGVEHA